MSDIADQSDDHIEQLKQAAITAVTNKPPAAESTGFCLQCDEPVADGKRWCDHACRDDWQRWNPEA